MAKPIPRLAPVTIATWSAIAAPSVAVSRFDPRRYCAGGIPFVGGAAAVPWYGLTGPSPSSVWYAVPKSTAFPAVIRVSCCPAYPRVILRGEAQQNQPGPGESALFYRLDQFVPGQVWPAAQRPRSGRC
jgi:hypothetical protein